MKIFKILLPLLLVTISGFSQNQHNTPYIEVTGTAQREIVPNRIFLDVTLEERMEQGNKIAIQQVEKNFKNELEACGISSHNLTISDLNAKLVKTGWWSKEMLATANYELKINNTQHLKDVFEIIEKLKIKNARITKATHSEIERLRKENRISAIKAAKEKADYLLNAIGEKTGKPIIVNEIEVGKEANFSVANVAYHRNKLSSAKTALSRQGNVQFKNLMISSSIYVKFEIK